MSTEEEKAYLVKVMTTAVEQYLDDPTEARKNQIKYLWQSVAKMGQMIAVGHEVEAFADKVLLPIQLMRDFEMTSLNSILSQDMQPEKKFWELIMEKARNLVAGENPVTQWPTEPKFSYYKNFRDTLLVTPIQNFLTDPSEETAVQLNEWVMELGRAMVTAEIQQSISDRYQR